MALSPGQVLALKNLARKRGGEGVAFINIADAQALTCAGLAERNREGWVITPSGAEALNALAHDQDTSSSWGPALATDNITPFTREDS